MFKKSSRSPGKLKIRKGDKPAVEIKLPTKRKNEELIIVRKSDPTIQKPSSGLKKLDVIIISVNYNDYLVVSLSNNVKIFENITVVTSPDDLMCQKICEKFGVNCLVTDVMYENGANFNKGKAINKGIESIVDPNFILLLDADIVITDKIDIDELIDDNLYISDRWICRDYNFYKRFIDGEIEISDIGKCENNKGLGFFQLFNINNNSIDKSKVFPEISDDAAWSDLMFRDKFTKRQTIKNDIIHLGDPYMNWNGRRTNRFLTDDEFNYIINNIEENFNINKYFDKIYCLNLDRRQDRFEKVKCQFDENNINFERWSAIDGDNFTDFKSNLNERISSIKGEIENKYSLACLLSHIEIIKDAKSKKYKKILIFEDDVILSKDFSEEVKILKDKDWKLFYLGASQFIWKDIQIDKGIYKCKNTLGTFAYAIDSSIYDDLLEILEKKEKSVDNYLSIVQDKYLNKCFTLYPNIVISDVEDSDIRKKSDIIEYSKLMKWELNKFENENKLISDVNLIKSSTYKTNQKKILFLINYNDTGGAEYVSYQHIKFCKELGYNPIVLSAGKGMFYEKIKKLDIDLYYCDLNSHTKQKRFEVIEKISKDVDIIYNCNYFEITEQIQRLKENKKFEYLTISHSDIDFVIDEMQKYESITDKYIVIHDKIRNALNKRGIKNTKIYTLPNFIEYEEINSKFRSFVNTELKNKLKINSNDFVIGMISRISPDKNIIDSIKILKLLDRSNYKLLIVGDSSDTTESILYKQEVLKLIESLDLTDKVIITGNVENGEVYKYISLFDISINTSPSEGLPISLLEIMACGKHCFYPSHGEIPEVLEGFGTVINLKQKKSLNKRDSENYIYSGYGDSDLLKYVKEIERLEEIKIDSNEISNHIKINRNFETYKYYIDFLFGGYKSGISFIIRARNEEINIENCIKKIVDIADEIIFVDHLSTDKTYELVKNLSLKYNNIKVFKYKNEIPRPGEKYHEKINLIGDSIANYYNFCLSKSTMNNIIKWDGDFIPIRENLIDMIATFRLRNRSDKFSLWFTGKTMFIVDDKNKYINEDSYYDEFRSFSLSCGVSWEDALRCEYINPNYIKESVKLKFENPIFYEIKNINVDEFSLRDSLIDRRDVDDYNIINNLRQGIITKNLKNYEI
jgi:GR25 family glycosyltransferase involved in LPS biosynthesis